MIIVNWVVARSTGESRAWGRGTNENQNQTEVLSFFPHSLLIQTVSLTLKVAQEEKKG
jgi:IS30 family transposase